MPGEEQDISNYASLPLEERLTHKLWKARLEAYEELSRLFARADGPKDAVFRTHLDTVRGLPAESNAAALESALGCLIAFLKGSEGSAVCRLRPAVLSTLIEKCIAAVKTGVRQKCSEALILFAAADGNNAEGVIGELCAFLGHKQPKVISGCLGAVTELLKEFGATDKTLIRLVGKQLGAVFQHPDKTVRAEASSLALELYRWIGPAIETFLEALKPIQVKELKDQFASVKDVGRAKPRHPLRSDDCAMMVEDVKTEEALVSGDIVEQAIAPEVDPYDLADPVKILDKLPSGFEEQVESSKWSERKEALEALLALLKSSSKLEDGHYSSLIQTLVKRLGDANILVVSVAAGCLEALAHGLRKALGAARVEAEVLPALLERCKEKKTGVLEALRSCLDALALRVLSEPHDLTERLVPFLGHKNPQVRTETLSWLSRGHRKAAQRKDLKGIIGLVLPGAEDGSAEVREASLRYLATLIAVSGEATVAPLLDGMDKTRLAKVSKMASELSSERGLNARPLAAAPTTVQKRTAPPSTPSKPAPTKQAKRETAAAPSSTACATPSACTMAHTDDGALAFFEAALPGPVFEGLGSAGNWKVRLEAMDSFLKLLPSLQCDAEMVLRFLGQRPGWRESNFQVLQRSLQAIRQLTLSREAVALLVPPVLDRLADAKLGTDAGETLLSAAEWVGPDFVSAQALPAIAQQKAPKGVVESLRWLRSALLAFGPVPGMKAPLLEAAKTQLSLSTNPLVRTAAIAMTVSLGQSFGAAAVRTALSQLPPATLSSLESEMAKDGEVPAPTRFVRSAQPAQEAPHTSNAMEVCMSEEERMELQVPADLVSGLSDAKWQTRKEALDALAGLVERSGRMLRLRANICPVLDVLGALRARYADSNKNLVIQALDLTGLLAEALGRAFDKNQQLRSAILPACLAPLADPKLQVRQGALRCLDALGRACRLQTLLPALLSALQASESPNLRRELIQWLAACIARRLEEDGLAAHLAPLSALAINALQDRTMEVRKASQALISACLGLIPADSLRRQCQELRPAMMSVLQGLIDSHVAANPAPVPPPLLIGSGLFIANAKKIAPTEAAQVNWSTATEADLDQLRAQMATCLHGPLVVALFGAEEKDRLNSLNQLEGAMSASGETERELIVASSALLLRYLSHHLLRGSAPKCLDVLERLLALIDTSNGRLSEQEVCMLLPVLVNAAGGKGRALFRQLCRIYPASRLFGLLADSLQKCKEERVLVTCLDEMQILLGRNGLVVLNAPKHVPIIAGLLGSQVDSQAVRAAVLDVLARLVGLMGEQLGRYLSDLTPAHRTLLEERLQRGIEPVQEEPEHPVQHESNGPFSLDFAQFAAHDKMACPASLTATPKLSAKLAAEATPPNPFGMLLPQVDQHPLERIVQLIKTSPDLGCIQSLQRLEDWLLPTPAAHLEIISKCIDELLSALCVRLRDCTSSASLATLAPEEVAMKSRLGRYVTNALVLLSSEGLLITRLQPDTLATLLAETLAALTSPELARLEDAEQLSRALNILLVKALENGCPASSFRALLALLEQAFRCPPASDSERYPEFIMKCLWKLTKQLPAFLTTDEALPAALLSYCHAFLCALPPLEWKARLSQRLPFEDLPLRTLKTIIHELVVAKGPALLAALSEGIGHAEAESSFVKAYIRAMLQASGYKEEDIADKGRTTTEGTALSPEEIDARLKEICAMICSKPNTRHGLVELYAFQQAHPSAVQRIDAYLEALGSFFYKYIKRNLAQIDAEHRLRQASAPSDVHVYKSRLAQMQQAMAEGGLVGTEAASIEENRAGRNSVSPVLNRLDSPFIKSPAVSRPIVSAPVKDSSIVNLKERLARLRTNTNIQETD